MCSVMRGIVPDISTRFYFRIVNQCERNLGDNTVVPKLKKMVMQYRESLPAFNALKSQYL